MLLVIALWILVAVIILLALCSTVSRALWEIIVPIINPTPVDLRSKFGEWAVVTGSTDGIGKAYAKELAARGVNLVLISRTRERLERTRDEILRINNEIKVKIVTVDFSKGREVFQMIESELRDIPVGILVNNVGSQYSYPMVLGEVPEEDIWAIINVNVGATTMMTRLLISGMQKRGKGAIVNVSSGSALQPLPLMTVYAATKVYLWSFSEALRAEYESSGITIQQLSPYFVNTKMNGFSDRLQVSSLFVPDPTTYARNAISTLGKLNTSTGYWAHGIQKAMSLISPVWIRTKIGKLLNQSLRDEYDKRKAM